MAGGAGYCFWLTTVHPTGKPAMKLVPLSTPQPCRREKLFHKSLENFLSVTFVKENWPNKILKVQLK